MFIRFLTIFAIFAVLAGFYAPLPAAAKPKAPACYSAAEAEADQGIRIHSELMVIGLNCQAIGKRYGQNLYGDYRAFTARYNDLFASYENILIGYFRRTGVKNPESSLNLLRTRYANRVSDEAAAQRPDIFCAKFAPRIDAAQKMSRDDVRRWAATIHPSHPVSYPLCKPAR